VPTTWFIYFSGLDLDFGMQPIHICWRIPRWQLALQDFYFQFVYDQI